MFLISFPISFRVFLISFPISFRVFPISSRVFQVLSGSRDAGTQYRDEGRIEERSGVMRNASRNAGT